MSTSNNRIIKNFIDCTGMKDEERQKKIPADCKCPSCPQGYFSYGDVESDMTNDQPTGYFTEKNNMYLYCFCQMYGRNINMRIRDCRGYDDLIAEQKALEK